MDQDIKDALDELDARILGQEHRFVHILKNFFWLPANSSKGKLDAVRYAFLWLLAGFVLPTTSKSSSSFTLTLVALAIAYFTYQATQQQATLLNEQNKLIRDQAAIAQATAFTGRVSELQAQLADANPGKPLVTSLRLEVINWSDSLVPYEKNVVPGRLLSRERGRLLRALVNSPADTAGTISKANFAATNLPDARFEAKRPKLVDANLEGSLLDRAVLSNADLTLAYLYNALLRDAYLDGAILNDADLTRADLRGADLRGADLRTAILSRTDIRGTKLDGARVDRRDWIEYVTQTNPKSVLLDAANWRVVFDPSDNSFRLRPRSSTP